MVVEKNLLLQKFMLFHTDRIRTLSLLIVNLIRKRLKKIFLDMKKNQVIEILGVFEEINNGTIYFKNINLMSNKLQGKILRILEEKKFYRIGALNSKTLNLRVIASCHQKLKLKKFLREDLFKKLNLNVIEVPNLEKRKEDLDELISIFSSQVIVEKSLKK